MIDWLIDCLQKYDRQIEPNALYAEVNRIRRGIGTTTDEHESLHFVEHLQAVLGGGRGQYQFRLDADDQSLDSVVWASADEIDDFLSFGQLLIVDATYSLTRFNFKLFTLMGIDSRREPVHFCHALIQTESETSIMWVLQTFQSWLHGRQLSHIVRCTLADGATGIAAAFNAVIPLVPQDRSYPIAR